MTAALSSLSTHRRECEICPRDSVGRLHIPQRGGRYHLCARHYIRARQDGSGKVVVGDNDLLPDLLASARGAAVPNVATVAPAPAPKPTESAPAVTEPPQPPTESVLLDRAVAAYLRAREMGATHHDALRACGRGPRYWRSIAALAGHAPPTRQPRPHSGGKPAPPLTAEETEHIRGQYRAAIPWQEMAVLSRRAPHTLRLQIGDALTESDHEARRIAYHQRTSARTLRSWLRRRPDAQPCQACLRPTPGHQLIRARQPDRSHIYICAACDLDRRARSAAPARTRARLRPGWDLTPDERHDLARLWREGESAARAAEIVRCHVATVTAQWAVLSAETPADDPVRQIRREAARQRRREGAYRHIAARKPPATVEDIAAAVRGVVEAAVQSPPPPVSP